MNTLIVGMGEVGTAHFNILKEKHKMFCVDLDESKNILPSSHADKIEVMIVCLRYSETFIETVRAYIEKYDPSYVNICSTVPPGTTRAVHPEAVHSTTRGLHPKLESGLRTITKHIGGKRSTFFKFYFEGSGIKTHCANTPETTEVAHILNNCAYGVNLMLADEMAKICRSYGVDYFESVMLYTATNNMGYEELDHGTKVRMILTPPNGKIGGHCVSQSANLIPKEIRTPILERLANYNAD